MNEIYDINNDKYFKKYLKYKIKYLELHNELEGGLLSGLKSSLSSSLSSMERKVVSVNNAVKKKLATSYNNALVYTSIKDYSPEDPSAASKLKEKYSDNNNYEKILTEIINKYPLGSKIKKIIETDQDLNKIKVVVIDFLSSNKISDINIKQFENSILKPYLDNINQVIEKEKSNFSNLITKYIEFAQKKYILYYNSDVVSYYIIDNIYRELSKKNKSSIVFILINYKDIPDTKNKLLVTLQKSSEYNERSSQVIENRTGENEFTDEQLMQKIIPRPGQNVISLKENINLSNDKVTYNVNNNTNLFKSTVLITPDNEYYYELSILFKLFDRTVYDSINNKINEIFNIYIHLLYIKNKIISNNIFTTIIFHLDEITRFIKELLVSTEINYNSRLYKINNINILDIPNLIKINKLITETNEDNNSLITLIKEFFDTKISNEIINVPRIKELKDLIIKNLNKIRKVATSNYASLG